MKRRRLLQLGALGAGAAGISALGYKYLPPAPSKNLRSVRAIATELFDSLSASLMDTFVVEYNHPFRQYHNRGVWAGGELVALGGFSRHQLSLITDLMYAGLSAAGRKIVPGQFYMKLPNVMVNNLLFCGDPHSKNFQVMFSGPHLNLRVGGRNDEGVAFGGPQVYGDQRGNEEAGLPNNVYQPQLSMGMELLHSLDQKQQALAIRKESPVQTQIELQGDGGEFPGISIATLSPQSRAKVRDVISLILKPYPESDVVYAWRCLDHNGGVEGLHLSYYEDSSYAANGIYQTYRLEGPSAVFYFRGFPHVHAFFNVAMDGNAPLSVGATVGQNHAVLEQERLKLLFEKSMLMHEQTDFAFYNLDSVVGKLKAGEIRTGDIYNAESWQSKVVRLTVKGDELAGELRRQLSQDGIQIERARTYTVATTDYAIDNRSEEFFGSARQISESTLLRDQVISYASDHGFG